MADISRNWQGIEAHRFDDTYFDATSIGFCFGKRAGEYLRLNHTKQYLKELSSKLGIPSGIGNDIGPNMIVTTHRGGVGKGYTHFHQKLVANYISWCKKVVPKKTANKPEPPSQPATAAADTTTVGEEVSSYSVHSPALGFEIRLYGEHSIQRRELDGFVNATNMARACGKLWGHYAATQRAKEYMSSLSKWLIKSNIVIPIIAVTTEAPVLIDSRVGAGAGGVYAGTWIHPRLATDFARWLNVDFAVWMDGMWKIMEQLLQHTTSQGSFI